MYYIYKYHVSEMNFLSMICLSEQSDNDLVYTLSVFSALKVISR